MTGEKIVYDARPESAGPRTAETICGARGPEGPVRLRDFVQLERRGGRLFGFGGRYISSDGAAGGGRFPIRYGRPLVDRT